MIIDLWFAIGALVGVLIAARVCYWWEFGD